MCLPSTDPATLRFSHASSTSEPGSTQDFTIKVVREKESSTATLGYMEINGKRLCYTLELPWRDNAGSISRIPSGTYQGFLRYDKTDKWRIQLKNVPGRSGIQIHVGNYPTEIEGCILVGTGIGNGGTSLTGSREAYSLLKESFYGSATPNMTPHYKITVQCVDSIQNTIEYYFRDSSWTSEKDSSEMMRIAGKFYIKSSGNWQLTFDAQLFKSSVNVEWMDFDIRDYGGNTIVKLRACQNFSLSGGTARFDSGIRSDSTISSKWMSIAEIANYTGHGNYKD
jgi:hypothetical protein